MKPIRAYTVRNTARKPSGSVCFLLNETHAMHTLRTFLRDQVESAVLEPVSDREALRLLGADVEDKPSTPPKAQILKS
jgi:hypothetical protein